MLHSIFVLGVPPELPILANDHSYAKPSTSVEMRPKPRKNGYTTLYVGGGEEIDTSAIDGKRELGQSVNLLLTNYKTVGTGVTCWEPDYMAMKYLLAM